MVNGRKYTTTYTGSTRTYVESSPVGRKTTTVIDTKGRIATLQAGGLLALNFGYDTRGRLATLTRGARTESLGYDTHGFLASLKDPRGETTTFTNDADGNPVKVTLPDGRFVAASYDASGNLTTLTPPAGAVHTFAYN